MNLLLNVVEFLNERFLGIVVPIALLLCGIYFCIKLRAFHFLHPVKTVKGMLNGNIASSVRALALALAGTLGVGNMVGVASAIYLGGVGAVFWMWVSALVAMILKYAEIAMAIRHRKYLPDGTPEGTATCYIEAAFGKRAGKYAGAVFAFLCILNALSMGSMIQVGAAAEAMNGVFDIPEIAVGTVFGALALFALLKGRSGVLSFTEKLVPVMTLGFMVLSLAVIFSRPRESVNAFALIFKDAFRVESGFGGAFGFLLSRSLRYGSMRGILSNEAGCGTSPAAHATAECKIPAKQGLWGIFEVFADTVLLCTLTAVVIIISYPEVSKSNGNYMMMTVGAFEAVLGEWSGYFIALAVLLFGLATVLCWGYYGAESAKYLSRGRRGAVWVFIAFYTSCVVVGSFIHGEAVWEIADAALGGMTLINLAALFKLRGEVAEETRRL